MTQEAFNSVRAYRKTAVQRHMKMTTMSLPTGKTVEEMQVRDEARWDAMKLKAVQNGHLMGPKPIMTKWKEPDSRISQLRKLAIASGKRYEKRVSKGPVKAGGEVNELSAKKVIWGERT